MQFDDIRCMYPDRRADWTEAEKDLNMDIVTANAILDAASHPGDRLSGVKSTTQLFESDERTRRVSISMTLSTDHKVAQDAPKSPKAVQVIEEGGKGDNFV